MDCRGIYRTRLGDVVESSDRLLIEHINAEYFDFKVTCGKCKENFATKDIFERYTDWGHVQVKEGEKLLPIDGKSVVLVDFHLDQYISKVNRRTHEETPKRST